MGQARSLVLLSTSLEMGGAETQVVRLACGLRGRGWEVSLVSMIEPKHHLQTLAQAGVPVASLGMRPGLPDPKGALALAALLRRQRPLVLHSHMIHANLLGRAVRLLARVPVLVSTAHSVNEGGRWRELAYRLTDPLADLTTQVSQAGLERYVAVGAVPRHKIRLVPNGVDTRRLAPDPGARQALRAELGVEGAFVWLAVGRLTEAKDYPNLLRAFARVHAARPEARLVVVGGGEQEAALRVLVSELALDGAVRLLGMRPDASRLFSLADAYAMSSAWEGLPMVLLEAAANGLPIVATEVGGNTEVVRPGHTGWLVPPRDSPALAEAMLGVMRTPPERLAEVGAEARRLVVGRYEMARVLDAWEGLYAELARRRQVAL